MRLVQLMVAMPKSPYARLSPRQISACDTVGLHCEKPSVRLGHRLDRHASLTSTIKKIAVTAPRGQSDDGDHGNMTGVDG